MAGPVALADATLQVQECWLVRSDPGGGGSRYTWLAAFALGAGQSARRR